MLARALWVVRVRRRSSPRIPPRSRPRTRSRSIRTTRSSPANGNRSGANRSSRCADRLDRWLRRLAVLTRSMQSGKASRAGKRQRKWLKRHQRRRKSPAGSSQRRPLFMGTRRASHHERQRDDLGQVHAGTSPATVPGIVAWLTLSSANSSLAARGRVVERFPEPLVRCPGLRCPSAALPCRCGSMAWWQ